MKKILLKVIGIVLGIGCAPAGAVDSTNHPGTDTPAVYQQALAAGAAAISAQGISIGQAHAGTLQLPSGANGTAASSNNSRVALAMASTAAGSVGSSLRTSGTPGRQQGNGYLVSAAAVPEPSGGAMLLCGLAVLAFIARRKTQSVVD